MIMDPRFGGPKNGDSIYLVPIDEESTDAPIVALEIDPESSYKVMFVNSTTGEFVFTNIPPGRYQILIEIAPGIIPLRSMETGRIDFLTIESNQMLDLGRMQIP